MKIIFEYYFCVEKEEYIPTCYSEERNEFNPLTAYLTDDMGGRDHIIFLKDSLNKLRSQENVDISSNSWGCDIDEESVLLYFLYAEDEQEYHLHLSKDTFVFIISEWIGFIESANYQERKVITIS